MQCFTKIILYYTFLGGPAKVFYVSIHDYTALSTVALTKLMKNTFATLICVLYTPDSLHIVLRNMV